MKARVGDGLRRAGELMADGMWEFPDHVPPLHPGTLNLECSDRVQQAVGAQPSFPMWSWRVRTFHEVTVGGYRAWAMVNRRRLEVVAPVRLRDELGLRTGDRVSVTPGWGVSDAG